MGNIPFGPGKSKSSSRDIDPSSLNINCENNNSNDDISGDVTYQHGIGSTLSVPLLMLVAGPADVPTDEGLRNSVSDNQCS